MIPSAHPLRRGVWLLNRAALAVVAALLAYALAGLIGGAIPRNADWRPPRQGVRIYVESNGIHTSILVPLASLDSPWRGLLRPEDLRDPRFARLSHIAIGWGDRAFYRGTPHWRDVRPGPVIRAAIGSADTVMHVEYVPQPLPDRRTRSVVLRPAEFARLAAFLRAGFAAGPDGHAPSVNGYGANDVFYAAHGTYDAFNTCNAWTGAALRAAGVRMGAWTPFPDMVLQWL